MTSKNAIFDPIKLEKLLIKDWISYIDPRKLLELIKLNVKNLFNIEEPKIQTLLISNCEFNQEGISLWVSYKIIKSNEIVNSTTQILLNPDGSVNLINTI
jgi:hypothetical protein